MNRRPYTVFILLGSAAAVVAAGFAVMSGFLSVPLSSDTLAYKHVLPLSIYDRNGILLRRIVSSKYGITTPVSLKDINPWIVRTVIALEDRNFYRHKGIDFQAMTRAVWQNVLHRHIVSGASTISQQTVNNIFHLNRGVADKIRKMTLAVRLEHTVPKDRILEQYLNRIPFGNEQYGIFSAAHFYFSRDPSALTPGQSVFLACIPQSPSFFDPIRKRAALRKKMTAVLNRMERLRMISHTEKSNILRENIVLSGFLPELKAPHFCEMVLEQLGEKGLLGKTLEVRTTLDSVLYRKILAIIRDRINALRLYHVSNCAVLVLDNRSGDVLALIGSKDYMDDSISGQFNAVFGLRQPGSAVKPLMYGLALENGFTAASVLPDIETRFPSGGFTFVPQNYDRRFHGPVLFRQCLACSYNVPTVYLLSRVGIPKLYDLMHKAGCSSLDREPEFYGLGLTLGNGDMTLMELTRAFTAFPLLGVVRRERIISSVVLTNGALIPFPDARDLARIFRPETSWLISDILSDNNSRVPAFGDDSYLALPFKAGVKTGTSRNYRDNWTVGFNRQVTTGVWVGNSDNTPMFSVSGVAGAGPIWHDIMLYLDKTGHSGWLDMPTGVIQREVCSVSGQAPGPYCYILRKEYFLPGTERLSQCSFHPADGVVNYPVQFQHWALDRGLTDGTGQVSVSSGGDLSEARIIYPVNKARFVMDPDLQSKTQQIKLRVLAPVRNCTIRWYVDGVEQKQAEGSSACFWEMKKGKHETWCRVSTGRSRTFETLHVFFEAY
jgi:penicillin-binding protein 1C